MSVLSRFYPKRVAAALLESWPWPRRDSLLQVRSCSGIPAPAAWSRMAKYFKSYFGTDPGAPLIGRFHPQRKN